MTPRGCFPDGQRQERRLALLSAAILWGEDLVAALLEAAHGIWKAVAATIGASTA